MTTKILEVIDEIWKGTPLDLVRPFYCEQAPFNGAYFELLGSDDFHPNVFAAADLYPSWN